MRANVTLMWTKLLLAVLLAVGLSSCENAKESSDPGLDLLLKPPQDEADAGHKTVLRLWSFHQAMEYDFWQWLAKAYEQTHPDIEIRVEYISSDEYFSSNRLLSSFASGQGPDLFFVSAATIRRFAEANILYPLTERFDPVLKADFYPNALDSVTIGEEIYAVPFEMEMLGLFYNKEMFAKAALEPPETWEEMMDAAKRLTSPKVSGLTIETYSGVFRNFSWLPFLWQTGGDILNADGSASGLSDQKPLKMYEFFRRMVDQGLLNMRPSRPTTDIGILASGETAMQVSGSWNLRMLETEFADEPIGVVPLPVPEGGAPMTIAGGWKIAANRQSEHAAEAAEFMMWAFAGEPDIPLKWLNETKFAYSPRQSVMALGVSSYRQGLREVFTDRIFGTDRAEPKLPEEIGSIFSTTIQELLFGEQSPQAIVDQADRSIGAFLSSDVRK